MSNTEMTAEFFAGLCDQLDISHIYEYYDGPLLYLTQSKDGEYLFYSYYADCTDTHAKHVYVPITAEQLTALESGKLSVWTLAKGKEAFSEYYEYATRTSRFVKELAVDEELPLKDLFIIYKNDNYYQEQIKPYLEYFTEAEDKAEAFTFCRERMEADMTTEAPRLKEMGRELSERLRRFGGTWAKQGALQKEALDHIRVAPDREQAFAAITGEMDLALERSRGLGR